jgi:hypothetical protein
LIRGTQKDWTEMLKIYPIERILETIEWTKQMPQKDKDFARFFINSDLLYGS